jgi:hypothetical protein
MNFDYANCVGLAARLDPKSRVMMDSYGLGVALGSYPDLYRDGAYSKSPELPTIHWVDPRIPGVTEYVARLLVFDSGVVYLWDGHTYRLMVVTLHPFYWQMRPQMMQESLHDVDIDAGTPARTLAIKPEPGDFALIPDWVAGAVYRSHLTIRKTLVKASNKYFLRLS